MRRKGWIAIVALVVGTSVLIAVAVRILVDSGTTPPGEDPARQFVFTTDKAEYTMGDVVAFSIRNAGSQLYRLSGWWVERLTTEAWEQVECHTDTMEVKYVYPGGSRMWGWKVAPLDPAVDPCAGTSPPVEPGLFRGVARLIRADLITGSDYVFVQFAVSA